MAEPFLAEIRVWACSFAPRGWAFCNGQILAIQQYAALFSLIGTYYGGNGTTSFGLPNMQGNVGVDAGTGPGLSTYVIGEMAGVPGVTLLTSEMPSHTHTISGARRGDATEGVNTPTAQAWLGPSTGAGNTWSDQPPTGMLSPMAVSPSGASHPHNNMQPYLALNFCIAMQGIFPSRN